MSGCRQPDDSFATLTEPATESSRSLDASAYPGLRESFAHAFPTLLGNNVEIVSSSPEVKDSLEADLAAEIQATQREEEAAIHALRTLPPTWQHVSTEEVAGSPGDQQQDAPSSSRGEELPAEAKRWILHYLKDVGADCVEEVYQLEESGWEFTRVLWIDNGFELEGVDSQGTEQAIFFPESKWEGGEPWEFPAWQEDGEEEEWEQGDDGEWWRGSWSEEEQDVEWKNSEKRLKKKRKASAETGVGGVLEKQPGGHSEEEPKKKRRKKKKASAETGGHAEEAGNRAQAVRAEAVPSGPIGEEEAKNMGKKRGRRRRHQQTWLRIRRRGRHRGRSRVCMGWQNRRRAR